MAMRLQKIIAQAGVTSRREAERLIDAGKVSVNGTVVRKQGSLVDPVTDRIQVEGRRLPPPQDKIYILFNKPRGCLTTVRDDKDRPTVMDYFKKFPVRVFPVGRLDFNTEGLLILTNDGDLSGRLLDPARKVPRTYQVKVRGIPDEKVMRRLAKGVRLDTRPTAPLKARIFRTTGKNCFLEMELTEGKKHHIKRICEKVGHPVTKISRTRFGKLNITGLPVGAYRGLTPQEIRSLRSLVADKK